MKATRREFLKGTAWMATAAMASGCMTGGFRICGTGGLMQGYAAPPLKRVRVGLIGLGARGIGAAARLSRIPGVELAAVCDVRKERIEFTQKFLDNQGLKLPALRYGVGGDDDWKRMCERDDIDVIYSATPWHLHAKTGLCAMDCGKHVFIEVPAAMTVDECWALVEKSESTQRHCMQLENCCYGEAEMLALNLCRLGLLGELVHGEGAYIHDLTTYDYSDPDKPFRPNSGGYHDYWRLRWNQKHKGNQYPTHGLGPVCQYMGINRGDRFDYLVSLESDQKNMEAYAKWKFPNEWKGKENVEMGDMNTTLIRTVKGRSILVQHDVSSPRPYSRLNKISGTMGVFEGINFHDDFKCRENGVEKLVGEEELLHTAGCFCRFGWQNEPGGGVHSYFGKEKAEEMRIKYRHPLWKQVGELAKAVGGHGGMDFLMDLRWAYCLQNGLPLDMDVYDLASWCSVCELSEKSVRSGSRPQAVPDFTRGNWRNVAPLGVLDCDMSKLDLPKSAGKADGQMSV